MPGFTSKTTPPDSGSTSKMDAGIQHLALQAEMAPLGEALMVFAPIVHLTSEHLNTRILTHINACRYKDS